MMPLSLERSTAQAWLRKNWFYPLALAIVLGDAGALRFQDWTQRRVFEGAVLFDLALVIPLLYCWCYRARGRKLILPVLGLVSFGVWATSHLIPIEHQHILGALGWLRPVAVALLVLAEIGLLFHFYKAIFTSEQTPEEITGKLAGDVNLPSWVTRLLALEARALRSLSRFVKDFLDRR